MVNLSDVFNIMMRGVFIKKIRGDRVVVEIRERVLLMR